jgi:hypothetical protein
MGVPETRNDASSVEIDDSGQWPCHPLDAIALTHRQELPVSNSDGFKNREIVVGCQDLAVVQNNVSPGHNLLWDILLLGFSTTRDQDGHAEKDAD